MESDKEMRSFTFTFKEGEIPEGYTQQIRGDYVEREWLAYLGPEAILLARRIAGILEYSHKSVVKIAQWAEEMKLSEEKLMDACSMLVHYGLATFSERDTTLVMQKRWPLVPPAILTPIHRQVLMGLSYNLQETT